MVAITRSTKQRVTSTALYKIGGESACRKAKVRIWGRFRARLSGGLGVALEVVGEGLVAPLYSHRVFRDGVW